MLVVRRGRWLKPPFERFHRRGVRRGDTARGAPGANGRTSQLELEEEVS
jgi:hypothetical protein